MNPTESRSSSDPHLDAMVACHECDLLMNRSPLQMGETLCCPRCGYKLASHPYRWQQRCLALVITALILYIPANFLPILNLNLLGATRSETAWSSVVELYRAGANGTATVVLLSSMIIPLLKLILQALVLLGIHYSFAPRLGMLLFRTYHHLKEWGMLEVYLIGILVSIVKLVDIADLSIGPGLACLIALLLTQLWLEVTLSDQLVWEELDNPSKAKP